MNVTGFEFVVKQCYWRAVITTSNEVFLRRERLIFGLPYRRRRRCMYVDPKVTAE